VTSPSFVNLYGRRKIIPHWIGESPFKESKTPQEEKTPQRKRPYRRHSGGEIKRDRAGAKRENQPLEIKNKQVIQISP